MWPAGPDVSILCWLLAGAALGFLATEMLTTRRHVPSEHENLEANREALLARRQVQLLRQCHCGSGLPSLEMHVLGPHAGGWDAMTNVNTRKRGSWKGHHACPHKQSWCRCLEPSRKRESLGPSRHRCRCLRGNSQAPHGFSRKEREWKTEVLNLFLSRKNVQQANVACGSGQHGGGKTPASGGWEPRPLCAMGRGVRDSHEMPRV